MTLNYLEINKYEDVDLQNILNDFIYCFTEGYSIVKIKHKNIQTLNVKFHKNNLPHLLGLHYTQNKKVSAKKIIGNIASGKITHESIKKHHKYNDIKERLLNYNFLHKCFIDKDIKLCVVVPENAINPNKLDIAFLDNEKMMFLGLRKSEEDEFYYPATMFVLGKNSKYNSLKRSHIAEIEWIIESNN